MLIDPGHIRTWLYTSEFKDNASKDEIFSSMEQFQAHNKSLNLSGFLITNGKAKEIQSAKMATIATNIARMLFDTTFEK